MFKVKAVRSWQMNADNFDETVKFYRDLLGGSEGPTRMAGDAPLTTATRRVPGCKARAASNVAPHPGCIRTPLISGPSSRPSTASAFTPQNTIGDSEKSENFSESKPDERNSRSRSFSSLGKIKVLLMMGSMKRTFPLLLLILDLTASAEDLYVATNGGDSNPGLAKQKQRVILT